MPCRCTARARTRALWLRLRDSCTLCPAGSGVPDTTHEQTTYTRRLARDTYNSCPEATTQKVCTNTHGLPGLVLSECCKATNQSNTLHCPSPSLLVSRHFPIKEASCGNLRKRIRRSKDSHEHQEKQQRRYSWPLSPRPCRLER